MSHLPTDLIVSFLEGSIAPQDMPAPDWGPIGEVVCNRTYSRDVDTGQIGFDNEPETRKETWAEIVRRVVNGNLGYAPKETWLNNEAIDLFDAIYNFDMIPAGRHLWTTGAGIHWNRNCWAAGWDKRTRTHFVFKASRLFEGGGVGANYSMSYVSQMSPIVGHIDLSIRCAGRHPDHAEVVCAAGVLYEQSDMYVPHGTNVIVTEDTREAWVETWAKIIDLACLPGHHDLIVDVSKIRAHGEPLKTFGGRASGPAPLATAVAAIVDVINNVVDSNRHFNGLDAMAIDHAMAASIVAGGARRSARMSLMHWNDPLIFEFLNCKADPEANWSTNISVEIDDDFVAAVEAGNYHASNVLKAVAVGMALNGEPGLFNSSQHSIGEPEPIRTCNPCVTGDMWVDTADGLRQVSDLEGTGVVSLVVNGDKWDTTPDGFFVTGEKPVLKFNIDGVPLRCTADHLISTPDGWRQAGLIKTGELVNLSVSFDGVSADTSADRLGFERGTKLDIAGLDFGSRVDPSVMGAGRVFAAGFLRAVFDRTATFAPSAGDDMSVVSIDSNLPELLADLKVMLASIGVDSVISAVECNIETLIHECRLTISGCSLATYAAVVWTDSESHGEILKSAVPADGVIEAVSYVGEVRSVVEDGTETVYDCQVPGANAFVANSIVVHNCGEASLQPWESCNLGSVNLDAFGTAHEAAADAFKLMARFLYRATLRPYPDELASSVEARNRRIGVGIMGLQGWAAASGVRLSEVADSHDLLQILGLFRRVVRRSADGIADTLRLPRPVKVTAIAPTGSIAQLPGVTPSIQAVHAKFFIRRVRYSDTDPALPELEDAGYNIVDDIYAANTKVVDFPVKDSITERFNPTLIEQSDDLSFDDFMRLVCAVQEAFCGGSDGQAISSTARIPAGVDPHVIVEQLRPHLRYMKGITVFPDASRALSPIEPITREVYESLRAGLGERELERSSVGDSNDGVCVGGACPVR